MRGFTKKGRLALLISMMLVMCTASLVSAKNMFNWRAVLYPNMWIKKDLNDMPAFLQRMADADYNAIFIDGAWMYNIHKEATAALKPAFQDFVAQAKAKGITVIPMSQGAAVNPYQDEDLIELFPNRGTPFVVSSGVAIVKQDPALVLPNGDFEKPLAGNWAVNDQKKFTIVDGGRIGKCVLCTDPDKPVLRMRLANFPVKPYRTYELTAWLKIIVDEQTKGVKSPTGGTYFTVDSPDYPWLLKNREFHGVPPNNQWKRIKQKFISLSNNRVHINLNATDYAAFKGKIWFDDAQIREVGLYDAVSHAGAPTVVRTASGQKLVEGKDYVVGDEKLTIPAGSSVKDGDELLVDWYTEANTFSRHSSAALCYDNVWNGVRERIQLQDEWFVNPQARFMKYSEWRVAGWDPVCIAKHNIAKMGSGPYYSAVANYTHDLYKEANCSRVTFLFNDVYDHYHNAAGVRNYCATNGGIKGSGVNLDKDIIILNWNVKKRKQSLRYFAGMDTATIGIHGRKTIAQRQVISAGNNSYGQWINHLTEAESEGLPDGAVIGMAYHNYKRNYSYLEAMASTCKKAGRWGTGPAPLPDPTPGCAASVAPGVPAVAQGRLSLAVMANAASGARSFRFAVPQNQSVNLSVYDLQGKKTATVLNEKMAAGIYQRDLKVSALASGMYFVSLTVKGQNAQKITRKMVIF